MQKMAAAAVQGITAKPYSGSALAPEAESSEVAVLWTRKEDVGAGPQALQTSREMAPKRCQVRQVRQVHLILDSHQQVHILGIRIPGRNGSQQRDAGDAGQPPCGLDEGSGFGYEL